MKSGWIFAIAALAIFITTFIATAEAQNKDMVQDESPNEIEPLGRKARQSRSRLGLGIGGFLGAGINIGIGGFGIGASAGAGAGIGVGIGSGAVPYGGGGELEAWACGVLCPDDGAGFIPYRAPRPTKGIFIGIRG